METFCITSLKRRWFLRQLIINSSVILIVSLFVPLVISAPSLQMVLSIRTFDQNGMTSSATILRALEYAVDSDVKIISMSWGSEVDSEFLETAMDIANQNGLKLYAAAGNKPTGVPVYPAGYDSVVAVGGLNPDGSQWENSNYGDFVEYY